MCKYTTNTLTYCSVIVVPILAASLFLEHEVSWYQQVSRYQRLVYLLLVSHQNFPKSFIRRRLNVGDVQLRSGLDLDSEGRVCSNFCHLRNLIILNVIRRCHLWFCFVFLTFYINFKEDINVHRNMRKENCDRNQHQGKFLKF